MSLDIEKVKAAALAATQQKSPALFDALIEFAEECDPVAVLELIARLEATEEDNITLLVAIEAKDASLRLIKYETDLHGNNLNRPIRVEALKALSLSPSTELLEQRDRKRDAKLLRQMALRHDISLKAYLNNLANARESGEWQPKLGD